MIADIDTVVARAYAEVTHDHDHAPGQGRGQGPGAGSVTGVVRRLLPLAPVEVVDHVVQRVGHRLNGLGALEPVLAEPHVTDVMITADGVVWVERDGVIEPSGTTLAGPVLDDLIERMVAAVGRRVDRSHPTVDARLPDGSRVHVAIPPVAVDGPVVTIRRFPDRRIPLQAFGSAAQVAELVGHIRDRRNVLVCGATGSGKTSLLNALGAEIDPTERVVTIEDAAELHLDLPHVVRLETRPAQRDGAPPVTVRDLVRESLRMRPDRIVVGEVRGPEAFDMVQAMLTGHRGCLSTVHAADPEGATRRLLALCQMAATGLPSESVAAQIADAIDVVVLVRRTGGSGRAVACIRSVRPTFDDRVAVTDLRVGGRW